MRIYVVVIIAFFNVFDILAQEDKAFKHNLGVGFGRIGSELNTISMNYRYELNEKFSLHGELGYKYSSHARLWSHPMVLIDSNSYLGRFVGMNRNGVFLNLGLERNFVIRPYASFYTGFDFTVHSDYLTWNYSYFDFQRYPEDGQANMNYTSDFSHTLQTFQLGLLVHAGLKLNIVENLVLNLRVSPSILIHDLGRTTTRESGIPLYDEPSYFSYGNRPNWYFGLFKSVSLNYRF